MTTRKDDDQYEKEIDLSALMRSTERLPGLEAESGKGQLGGSFAVDFSCAQSP